MSDIIIGLIVGVIIGTTSGGLLGFFVCALIVNGRKGGE